MPDIRVGIADDHPIVLTGISGILRHAPDIKLLFQADSIQSLMAHIGEHEIDVLICDYEFDGDDQADGITLLRRLVRVAPKTKVLFLSAHSATHVVSTALMEGAAGFVGKSKSDFVALTDAVRRVFYGETYVPPSIASLILYNVINNKSRSGRGIESLSPRELEVVRLICAGHTIMEVAQRVNRSPKTISNQKNSAMKKLAVRNDVELAQAVRDLDAV
ncbi:response regulator transcription factor [Pandoraea sputorum]|uniref:DNA-binding response regulator n=1 Tax=Pandoraea sputorum TaxID=93222 RepID=A0A5E5ARZ9_9BURK|nr:response regulator transcription factor [Pandoraea sputorum]VVE75787.1 DNA-binding response regulator [Pandoraea sputorum]